MGAGTSCDEGKDENFINGVKERTPFCAAGAWEGVFYDGGKFVRGDFLGIYRFSQQFSVLRRYNSAGIKKCRPVIYIYGS